MSCNAIYTDYYSSTELMVSFACFSFKDVSGKIGATTQKKQAKKGML
jgi:hypothetical protein